jgi:hypothetical protein
MKDTGTLIIGRVKGMDRKFVLLLVSTQKCVILQSSRALTEAELRENLAENHGMSEHEIEAWVQQAKERPEI